MRDCHLKHIVIGMWPRVCLCLGLFPKVSDIHVCMHEVRQ